MARIFKTLEELKAEAIARYENKKQKNLVGPNLKDTLTCKNMVQKLKGEKICFYDEESEEWYKGTIVSNKRVKGRTYQEIKFDDADDTVQLDLLFDNHPWCCTTLSQPYANACVQMDWVRNLLL